MSDWSAKKRSRTWKITVYWSALIPLMLLSQVVLAALGLEVELPMGEVVALAGAVTTAYLGKRMVQEGKKPNG